MKELFRTYFLALIGLSGAFCLAAPPTTATALTRETFIYLFEIDGEASLGGLPTLVPAPGTGLAGAADALRRAVAEQTGVPVEAVTLRGAAFAVDARPRLEGPAGQKPALRVRVCPHGDPARRGELLAEAIVPPEGGVLLVPQTRDRRQLVTAFFETLAAAGDGDGSLARQDAFRADTDAALGPPLASGYLHGIGDCE